MRKVTSSNLTADMLTQILEILSINLLHQMKHLTL